MEFHRESPDPLRGNPPDEWNSAGIYWLLDEESTRRMEFRRDYWLMDKDQTGKIKNLPISNNSRNINSKGSLPHKNNF
jgi:hypothetical protein